MQARRKRSKEEAEKQVIDEAFGQYLRCLDFKTEGKYGHMATGLSERAWLYSLIAVAVCVS
jgi:hypothetical protein